MSAYKVWSFPMPTLLPGCILVPLWRTIIFPALTNSEPNFFTPKRVFLQNLCYSACSLDLSCVPLFNTPLCYNFSDSNTSEISSKTTLGFAVFSAAFFESDDFFAAPFIDHFRFNFSPIHKGFPAREFASLDTANTSTNSTKALGSLSILSNKTISPSTTLYCLPPS